MDDKTISELDDVVTPRLKEFDPMDIEKVWESNWFFS